MGLRGPAPKLTSQRILEGNPAKRPINHAEPNFACVEEFAPCAKLTPRARKLWDAKVRAIAGQACKQTDIAALTMLVQTEARAFALSEAVDSGAFDEDSHELAGLFVREEGKRLRQSAAFAALASERAALMAMWNRFGHTPADRVRIVDDVSAKPKSAGAGVLSGQWKNPELGEAIQ